MWNKSSTKNGGHCISNQKKKKKSGLHCLNSERVIISDSCRVKKKKKSFASLGEEWGRYNEEH